MKIAITGHRPNKLGNDYTYTSDLFVKIKQKLQKIIDFYNPEYLITGMALGVDTVWALLAIENNIKFIAAIPCLGQDSRWKEESKDLYKRILSNDLCIFEQISYNYSPDSMQKRNIWMVNTCDVLIAVWDGSNGGTANCVNYAIKQGKIIIYINPKNI